MRRFFVREDVMSEVEYRPIPGWEGLYSVGSDGQVYTENWRQKKGNRRPLRQMTNKKGYKRVHLCRDGVCFGFSVHRLVCIAFYGYRGSEWHVNHKDFNRANNSKENLEWCTPEENIRHAADAGKFYKPGEKHPRAKLTDAQVLEISKILTANPRQRIGKALAERYGTSISVICNINTRRGWRHLWPT